MTSNALVTLLESILGKSYAQQNNNHAFHCPFCNHRKKKLIVNVVTQHFHCWVCNTGGRKIYQLFRKLNVSRDKYAQLSKILDDIIIRPDKTSTKTAVLDLPKEYIPLWMKGNSPDYKNAIHYLKSRNITIADILKYKIGYCESGIYSGKIIVPSFDENGSLNYFISRAIYSADNETYKNPKFSKDIIGFELYINWDMPICLVEGVFDAFAIRHNAIPLFGKHISNTLKQRIVDKKVKTIYVCLDEDARKQAVSTAEYFMVNGISVHFIELPQGQDPSSLGYEKINEMIKSSGPMTETELLQKKILCAL